MIPLTWDFGDAVRRRTAAQFGGEGDRFRLDGVDDDLWRGRRLRGARVIQAVARG